MLDALLDSVCFEDSKDKQIYYLQSGTGDDFEVSLIAVDSPKELDYHEGFPVSLDVGDIGWCDYDSALKFYMTKVIRVH